MAYCNSSIDLNPDYVKPYIKRAEIKMKNQEFDAAINDYHKIGEIDPS